jgi:hypothetical protein
MTMTERLAIHREIEQRNAVRNRDFSEAGGYIRQHIGECWKEDEDGRREFDWDEYQAMCDQADYWDM